jgi:hypothetical protein
MLTFEYSVAPSACFKTLMIWLWAREQTNFYRQAEPSFVRPDVRKVRDPDLAWRLDPKLAIQGVRCCCRDLSTFKARMTLLASYIRNSDLFHQSIHPVITAR